MKNTMLILLIAISATGYTQPKALLQKSHLPPTYQKLKIGEKVPEDFIFSHLINYPKSSAKISDFKGKIVILDFWNMACGPCIGAFPKMQRLQEKYKDRVQILLINVINTWDQLEREGFPDKTKSPIIPQIKLPFVVPGKDISKEDIIRGIPLRQLFAHAGEPFHAWIDEDGVLRATTKPGYVVTENSILHFLKHKSLESGGKSGTVEDLGMEEFENASILKLKNEIVGNSILYSSVIFNNLNVGRGLSKDLIDSTTGKLIGLRREGRPILDLYLTSIFWSARQEKSDKLRLFKEENRVILDVKDPKKYLIPKDPDEANIWQVDNTYYYELKLPAERMGNDIDENRMLLYQTMKADLERVFGIYSYVEKRKTLCWILKRTSNVDKISAAAGRNIEKIEKKEGFSLRNSTFREFFVSFAIANRLEFPARHIINETGFDENKIVEITIRPNLSNIKNLQEDLKKYDLSLLEQEREIEVIVISEKIKI